MADLIRAACLTHYTEVARSVGIDPAKFEATTTPCSVPEAGGVGFSRLGYTSLKRPRFSFIGGR